MAIINHYNPKDELKIYDNILFYGAGTGPSSYSLIGLAALRSIKRKPTYFIDDNYTSDVYKQGFQGVRVISPEGALHNLESNQSLANRSCIIVTSNYFSTIIQKLKDLKIRLPVYTLTPFADLIKEADCNGLINIHDLKRKLFGHNIKANQFLRINTPESHLNIPFMDIQLTERCTMKCKDCSNLMQYYKKPTEANKSIIEVSLKKLFTAINILGEARLIGGEPFLFKEIGEICKLLNEETKVQKVIIYTNGTIIPKDDALKEMSSKKITIEITDYGYLSRKRDLLVATLNDNNINYVLHKPQNWTDSARIIENDLNESELASMFKACCVNDVFTLLHGNLYHCPFSANVHNLRVSGITDKEFINIADSQSIEDLKINLKEFCFGRPFLDACRKCLGRDFTQPNVEPAIQTRKPIEINV